MSDALKRLIEAVEAGDFPTSWTALNSAGVAHGSYGLPMRGYAWDAFHGSLDAAKALHIALLGDGYIGDGYLYCIWGSGKASVWEIISGASVHADIPEKENHAVSPARAWLLAILRAYQQVQS